MAHSTLQIPGSRGYLSTMVHILIISQATLSDGTDDSSQDPNNFCTALEDCIGKCSSASLSDVSCWNETFPCDCGDVKCFLFKGVCVNHCGSSDSASAKCYDCLIHENLDICLESCSKSGICLASDCLNSPQLCEQCLPGYYGVNCNQKCSDTCEGSCNRGNGYCGQCETGSFGQSCELSCPLNCYKNDCLAETGHCHRCSSGYRGPTCSNNCESGFYGHSCRKPCSPKCERSHCEPTSGQCVLGCKPGFFNIRCEQECPSGTYGKDCLAQCPVTCSGGALCDPVNGTCLHGCTTGFQGDYCNILCPVGKFGENCENNCSDNCFLRVCNSFSGHCERCIWERDGPFCEKVKVEELRVRGMFDSDLTSDQILLTFLTLFGVGAALWFLMALSMYHRRKLVWQKIWKTGKIPYHHRLPKSIREFLERSGKPTPYRYSSLGGEERQRRGSPTSPRQRGQRREGARLKKSLRFKREASSDSSAETLDDVDQSREFSLGLDLERGTSGLKPEPKDDITLVKGSAGDRPAAERQEFKKEATALKDARDECLVVPEETIRSAHHYAIKHTVSPLTFDTSRIPSAGSRDSLTENLVGSGSYFSSMPQYSSERWSDRVTKLLKKTTRTRPSPRVRTVQTTRQSLSTEGTTTSTHHKPCVWRGRKAVEDIGTETETDSDVTSGDTAMEISRNISSATTTETETETVNLEGTDSEVTTEAMSSTSSSSWTKSSTASKRPYLNTPGIKPTVPKVPLNIQQTPQKIAAPKIWTTNTPSAMPLKRPPIPVRQTGILQKGYAYLASMWPLKIGFAEKPPLPKKPPLPAPPQKRYLSYKFMLTRLEEWRRLRGYQHDVRDGVFEVKDEKSKTTSSSAVTTESTVTPLEISSKMETTVPTKSYTRGSSATSGIASSTLVALSTWSTSETMTDHSATTDTTSSEYYVDANSSYRTHPTRRSVRMMRHPLEGSETTREPSTRRMVAKNSSSTLRDFLTRSEMYNTTSSRPSIDRSVTSTSNDNSCFVYSTTETRSTSRDYSKYDTDESNYQMKSSWHPTPNTFIDACGPPCVFSPGRSSRGQPSMYKKERGYLLDQGFNKNSHRYDVAPLGVCTPSVHSSYHTRTKPYWSGTTDKSTTLPIPKSSTPTPRNTGCQSTVSDTSTLTATTGSSMTE